MENGKKIALIMAITLAVIANLLLANNVSAKQFTINESDIKQVQGALGLAGILSEIMVSDAKLKTLLNLAIKGGGTGADITYGLLVLSSLDEMDFIDMVISQRYKGEADAYFNSVLDRRLNVAGYYKGTAFDIFRVASGRITSPMAALTLNSFDITDKTLEIFTAFNILRKETTYDGLWNYFDLRKNNETHEVAWSDAKDAMGFAGNSTKLESQFVALYEKWGPYVEINKGVKKEFKEQVKRELQQTLALAAEEQALAEKERENKLSFLGKIKLALVSLMKEAEKAMVKIQELTGLGGAQVSQAPVEEIASKEEIFSQLEIGSPTLGSPVLEINSGMTIGEMQEILDDIAEKIDIISQKVEELTGQTAEASAIEDIKEIKPASAKESTAGKKDEIIPVAEDQQTPTETVVFNYGTSPPPPPPEPATPKILISEIQISPIGERFVEIYNPNNEVINLSGWYIQRKTETGSSWSSFISSTHFEGKTIGALSHFFVASSAEADIILDLTLTDGNSLILKSPNRDVVDKVGWGEAQEFETFPTENPLSGKSIGRKWSTTTQNYIDTDNNQTDFEIQTPTPGAKNQTPSTPPTSQNQIPIANLSFSPQSPLIGQEIIFDAASSSDSDGTITAFIWDFGDSSSTTTIKATTTHSFTAPGNFLITLIVGDDKNATSSAATSTITVANIETPSLLVALNEIAWMGTKASANDEWIELYNNTISVIDLTDWKILKNGEEFIKLSTSTILANGFYLLERTASNTTDLVEDQVYTGFLRNDGEKLELRDNNNILIDLVDFSAGWPAGSSTPNYISMERINSTSSATSTNWANNNLLTRNGLDADGNKINGTPRAQNSVSASSTIISSSPFDEFSEITLTKSGSPYIIQQSLIVPIGKTLKIESGAILKFEDSREIEVRGNLKAIGNDAEKIVFERNSTSSPGNDRYRIYFNGSQNSIIDNVNLIDGGRLTYVPFWAPWGLISAAIEVENSSISIKNSLITGAFPRGINSSNSTTTVENTILEGIKNSDWFLNTFALLTGGENSFVASSTFKNNTIGIKITRSSPRIENNIFQENNTPILLEGVSYPVFSNNSAQNNGENGISVDGADIIADTVWQSNLPYIVGSKSIAAGVTLTLKEGTVVKLSGNLIVSGRLVTEGTLVNPVVITSIADDEYGGDTNNNGTSTLPQKGNWQQIRFQSLATSTLEGVKIRYGSGGCDSWNCWGAINLVSGGLEIKNSWIEKNIWGIFSGVSDCPRVFETLKLTNVIFSVSENERDIALPSGVNCSPSF